MQSLLLIITLSWAFSIISDIFSNYVHDYIGRPRYTGRTFKPTLIEALNFPANCTKSTPIMEAECLHGFQ